MANKWGAIAALIKDFFPEHAGRIWKPWSYATPAIALDNASNKDNVVFAVPMQDGEPFIWLGGLYKCDNAAVMAGTDTLRGGFTIFIENLGGYGPMQNDVVSIDTLFGRGGTSGEWLDLPFPMRLKANSTIAGKVSNKTGVAVNLYLHFIGVKPTSST